MNTFKSLVDGAPHLEELLKDAARFGAEAMREELASRFDATGERRGMPLVAAGLREVSVEDAMGRLR